MATGSEDILNEEQLPNTSSEANHSYSLCNRLVGDCEQSMEDLNTADEDEEMTSHLLEADGEDGVQVGNRPAGDREQSMEELNMAETHKELIRCYTDTEEEKVKLDLQPTIIHATGRR